MVKCYLKDIFLAIILAITLFEAATLSTGSPVENDAQLIMLLRAQFDGLQSKLDQLAIRNSDLEEKVAQLTTQNQAQKEQFNMLKADYETKVGILMAESEKQDEDIRLLKNQNSANCIQPTNQYEKNNMKVAWLVKMKIMREQILLQGYHLRRAVNYRPSATTWTVFTLSLTRSSSSDFSLTNAVIPFEVEQLNEGGAMNLDTGIFTVPVGGIYHFEFTGMKDVNAADIYILLQVNGVEISRSLATGNFPNFLSFNGISASLRLKVGDQIRLYKAGGTLNDNFHYTHFTGWLVEEDLVFG